MMPNDSNAPRIIALLYANDDWNAVQTWASRPERRSLTVPLASLSASDCIATILDAMAHHTLQKWPYWYGGGLLFDALSNSLDDRLRAFFAAIELSRNNRSIELSWLKKATHLASIGKPPLIPGLVGEIQVRQLALALADIVVDITLAVPPVSLDAGDCKGFPHVVEWLARESDLNVTVLLPKTLSIDVDFSSLLYSATDWAADRLENQGDGISSTMRTLPNTATFSSSAHIPDENAPEAERIIGSPHPRSKGEQLLAERLAHDPHLSGLFEHNQPVKTRCGHKFIVDLLWYPGKTVVEVDGYYYHSNTVAFANDRDRDYRLLLSGYHVLRIPHDEVIRDVDLAVEKIRDVVNFVRNQEAR